MKWLTSFILALVSVAGSGEKFPLFGAAENGSRLFVSHFENVLGTSMELKVLAGSEAEASIAESAAVKEIGRLQQILSAYDDRSEFSQWLRTSNEAVHVSPELFEVLGLFDQWRIRTGGALDASAEVITKLWKHSATSQRIPTDQELATAVSEVKQPHWKLDSLARTATHLSQVPLMLNSFAKSYIIKHAADAAMASGNVRAIVVNIGGDLVIAGDLKETVQISDPKADAENDPPMDQLELANQAVATSGNYRRYSHIVDPRTGQPADAVLSATVVAPNATDAGALATAFNVLSPSESIRLAAGLPGVEYLIVTKSGERLASTGWHLIEVSSALKSVNVEDDTRRRLDIVGSTNDFELVVNLEINLQKEGFAKRPYVAVWVEDENHAPVRTIAIWHERDRYLPELKSWYLKYRGIYTTDQSELSTVSSATRSAGKYTLKWDGKDDKGNIVKPGKYTIKIEATREHGTYQLMRQELEWNDTPQLINLPGNVEISSVSFDYRKKTVGN
jgi:FAD:protein FMN transferase